MPSELQNFVSNAFSDARSTIGGESLVIGTGATLSAVLSEITSADTYSNTGFIPSALFQAVVDSDEFTTAYPLESKNYVGKKVTARGIVFRLTEVMNGASFVTIKLESITKS